jgi:hypothetical protein
MAKRSTFSTVFPIVVQKPIGLATRCANWQNLTILLKINQEMMEAVTYVPSKPIFTHLISCQAPSGGPPPPPRAAADS